VKQKFDKCPGVLNKVLYGEALTWCPTPLYTPPFIYETNLKISPGTYFSKVVFEGLIFEGAYIRRGAYVRREICISKSFRLTYGWKKIYCFFFVLFCIWGHCFHVKAHGGVYSEGPFDGGRGLRYGFEGLMFGGTFTWRGLFSEFYCTPFICLVQNFAALATAENALSLKYE